ncbi:MAG: hypothetical protein JO249_23420 [Acidobacteria bacterium]|nr:hypothetical protein [Acidobacteriota bacterium]
MADKPSHDQERENVMNHLANSVLELSDEELLAEAEGAATQQAERTRAVLLGTARLLETVNQQLLSLGHTISPQRWQQHADRGYRNHCLTCGFAVSLTPAGEIWGNALEARCPQAERSTVRKRTASAG